MAPSPSPRPPSYSIKHTPVQPSGCPNAVEPILIKRNYNDFSILKFLSIGDHGTVYLARDVNTGREYALKVLPKDTVSTSQASNEARLQALVATDEDSFLLPLKATWHDTLNYYLVTDFMPGGDLAAQLASSADSPFDEDHTRFYGAEMIMILEELHKHRIIHRDIKPSNLLVDSQGHLRLTGFRNAVKFEAPQEYEALDSIHASLSFDVDPNSEYGAFFLDMPTPEFKASEICGTPGFMSPQRTKGESYGDEEDLWSVGVVLYLMLTGRMPFGNDYEGRPEIAFCMLRKDVLFKPTDLISDNARSLLVGMLAKDTRTRLSIEQIKRHGFFKGLDWELVRKHGYPAPWMPPPTYSPKFPMYSSPIIVGIAYKPWNDPLPEYSYTSPRMNELKPYPAEAQKTPSERIRMAMARVLGIDDTVDFRHDTEEHSEEDEDDTWFAYEEDDEHLPIQYIDYSELPFGSHPLDRKLGLDFVFDFEEAQSLTAESQDDDTQTITREVYLRDSWFAALADLGRAEQDVATPPAVTIRRQTLARTVHDSEKDRPFGANRQSFPSFAEISTPSYPPTQGRTSIQPGCVVPPSFYQHFSHGFEAQAESQHTSMVNSVADSYDVDDSSPFEPEQGFEGLMLFVMDMDQVIPLPEKNLYENPRSAPIPPTALPLSPTSTLFPELGSPSIPDRQSITTSVAPWQSVPKVDFFEKYRDYRLKPKHILARRALAAQTIEPPSLMNQAATQLTTGSQFMERRKPNLHHGLVSRLPAPATQTSINVEADMDQDVQLASKKRGSVELLKSLVEDTTSEEEEIRLPSALRFFGRVRGKLTGWAAESGGGAFGVMNLAATSQNTGTSVSSKTEAACYN